MTREMCEHLRETIRSAEALLKQLQETCPHPKLRRRLFRDHYSHQGLEVTCDVCSKLISLASAPVRDVDAIITKDEIVNNPELPPE